MVAVAKAKLRQTARSESVWIGPGFIQIAGPRSLRLKAEKEVSWLMVFRAKEVVNLITVAASNQDVFYQLDIQNGKLDFCVENFMHLRSNLLYGSQSQNRKIKLVHNEDEFAVRRQSVFGRVVAKNKIRLAAPPQFHSDLDVDLRMRSVLAQSRSRVT